MNRSVPRIGITHGRQTSACPLSSNDNNASGFRQILAKNQSYEVAQMKVPPRCNLPLQRHEKASKHLTVLSGIVHVTLGDDVMVLVADESIYIPQGALHGLENRADAASIIVSVDYIA